MARGKFLGLGLVEWAAVGGGGWLLFTEPGRAKLTDWFPGLAQSLSNLPMLPASPVTPASGNGSTAQPPAPASPPAQTTQGTVTVVPDRTRWAAYKSAAVGDRVMVKQLDTGEWRYVRGPTEYEQYGIAADESNIVVVPANEGGKWFSQTVSMLPARLAEHLLRVDTRTGLANDSVAQATADTVAVQQLCEAHHNGAVVPANVHGAALLAALNCIH